jgi:hypothetical protein
MVEKQHEKASLICKAAARPVRIVFIRTDRTAAAAEGATAETVQAPIVKASAERQSQPSQPAAAAAAGAAGTSTRDDPAPPSDEFAVWFEQVIGPDGAHLAAQLGLGLQKDVRACTAACIHTYIHWCCWRLHAMGPIDGALLYALVRSV